MQISENILQAVGWRDHFGTCLLRPSPDSSLLMACLCIPPSPPRFSCQVGCGHLPGISGMPPDALLMTRTGFLQHISFREHVNNARQTMLWLHMEVCFFFVFFFSNLCAFLMKRSEVFLRQICFAETRLSRRWNGACTRVLGHEERKHLCHLCSSRLISPTWQCNYLRWSVPGLLYCIIHSHAQSTTPTAPNRVHLFNV